jgi:hypothetical protein
VHNVKTAVRRLPFAPAGKEMQVTDVKTGHFLFRPRSDRPARFGELRRELVNQGYDLEGAMIDVRGELSGDRVITATGTGQVFTLSGALVDEVAAAAGDGGVVAVIGWWKSDAEAGQERIEVTRWEASP